MILHRSTKCTLKYTNKYKKQILETVLQEYANIVNYFINQFWDKQELPENKDLLASLVNPASSWFTHRMKKTAAREAIGMIKANQERDGEKAVKPIHHAKSMTISSTIATLQESTQANTFDAWLHLASIGNGISLDIPIKLHKHYHQLNNDERSKRLNSYTISKNSIQFVFEINTGPKQPKDQCIGIDTGINALASLSTGEQVGTDIRYIIDRINRCKHGSKRQKKLTRSLKQRINEVAKEVTDKASLIVVENLKNITKNTKKPKRRLGKNMRRVIGRSNMRYWQQRLEMTCEEKNVSFRRVSPWNTSRMCSSCGHTDKRNRNGENFLCQSCGYIDNADLNAAKNILERFLSGPYGAGCQAKEVDICLYS